MSTAIRSILIQNKSIYFKEWVEKGFIFVHDLVNEDGRWMTFTHFTNRYKIGTNFLRYVGMINAIKSYLNIVDMDLLIKPTINFQSFNTKECSGRTQILIRCKSQDFYLEFVLI